MLGLIWWPMLDQVDWDGALTHRIGKVHEVGLFTLSRQPDGTLKRVATPLVKQFREVIASGETRVGKLEQVALPVEDEDEQLPPLEYAGTSEKIDKVSLEAKPVAAKSNGNGNGHAKAQAAPRITEAVETSKQTDRYGIVVFSHLRWGFVWQRPQQFLSRFARKHSILFVEEPFFDVAEGGEARVDLHRVMPNVTVATPHISPSWAKNPGLPKRLQEWTAEAIERMNE